MFVGDLPNGSNYHIIAYHSSGTQFDDFGAGLFGDPDPQFGILIAPQIAADETTHKLYVGDSGKFYIFDKVTIDPPTATIEPATPVGQITSTLNAKVNANGHAALECKLEYIDDSGFLSNEFASATSTPCPSPPDGSGDTMISAKVSGLSPVTLYHYRIKVTTNAGSTTSGAETFETLPVVPSTVTTEPAVPISQSVTSLRGKVNPHGGSASDCHFRFGTSASYGTNLPCAFLPGPVATDVAVSRSATGLLAGTTYHYRLVVTTNAGTVEGNDGEFTTQSPPPPPPPPTPESPPAAPPVTPAPPPTVTPPTPHPLHCKKGFQKKKVRGKVRCVKKKRHAKHRRAQSRDRSR